MIQNPNFLILDEPTNDLDIVTLNVLENFLLDFPGCLIVVSHDRYFMDKIVDHLFVFRGNGIIQDFPGNYSDYRVYESSKEPEVKVSESTTETKTKNTWKKDNKAGLSYNEQKEFNRIERDLKKLELQKKEIENMFVDGNLDAEKINEESLKLKKIIQEIEEGEMRWLELSEKLEE